MTAANYTACEDRVLAHEGSKYTDGIHPYDPGGPTRWGITLIDARLHWKKNATSEDVRTMPREIAMAIYRSKYWAAVRADDLPSGVDDVVFDYGVNSGVGRAGKVLRRVLGLSDSDWHVSDAVITASGQRKPDLVIDAICDERLHFLQSLKIWPIYKNGWTTRVSEVRQYSHQLAKAGASGPRPTLIMSEVDSAKGSIAAPSTAKNAVGIGGAGSLAVAGGGFTNWISGHPTQAALIAAGAAIIIGGAIYLINENHRKQQEAATEGLVPVPVGT